MDHAVVDLLRAMERHGGFATTAELLDAFGRPTLRRTLRAGAVVRLARGRYALASHDDAAVLAFRHTAHAHLLSAALLWGWPVKNRPSQPQLVVPRGRKVPQDIGADVRWSERRDGLVSGRTSRVRTVLDCAEHLPLDEAVCVADSALREGKVSKEELEAAAMRLRPNVRHRVVKVLELADGRSANPFETTLRLIAQRVGGLEVIPQHEISDATGFVGRVDLADVGLRLVIEAEGYEFHGGRDAFVKDCRRYNRLVCAGWLVLRFTWEEVMFRPEEVEATIRSAVALRRRAVERTVLSPVAGRPRSPAA